MMRALLTFFTSSLLLTSCGNVHLGMGDMERPVTVSSIVLDQPLRHPPNKKVHTEYHAGTYSPVGQDDDGTYYQSARQPRLHDIAEWLSKDVPAGLYLRDDLSTGLEIWARNGELVGHGPVVKKGSPQPPYRLIRSASAGVVESKP